MSGGELGRASRPRRRERATVVIEQLQRVGSPIQRQPRTLGYWVGGRLAGAIAPARATAQAPA